MHTDRDLTWVSSSTEEETMPTLEIVTAEQAQDRIAALLRDSGYGLQDLRERAAAWLLNADELSVLTQVEELEYLISG